MCGKLLRDWFQKSLIISLALSLIVGEELVLYIMLVLVEWAPYVKVQYLSIRMFNRLPKAIRMLSSCSVVGFKKQPDSYLRNFVDVVLLSTHSHDPC